MGPIADCHCVPAGLLQQTTAGLSLVHNLLLPILASQEQWACNFGVVYALLRAGHRAVDHAGLQRWANFRTAHSKAKTENHGRFNHCIVRFYRVAVFLARGPELVCCRWHAGFGCQLCRLGGGLELPATIRVVAANHARQV